ncbi:MAG TPA: TraR/DksA family transcriptional regulator [Rhodospirillaceae bacterium]|nr:TraR/DksA family transcriptional regulator [Rhodospirillaceae bacterium]
MDDIDFATERAEVFSATALQAVLARLSGPPSSGVCRSCYEVIEPKRRQVAPLAKFCSDCAAEEEFLNRRTLRIGQR